MNNRRTLTDPYTVGSIVKSALQASGARSQARRRFLPASWVPARRFHLYFHVRKENPEAGDGCCPCAPLTLRSSFWSTVFGDLWRGRPGAQTGPSSPCLGLRDEERESTGRKHGSAWTQSFAKVIFTPDFLKCFWEFDHEFPPCLHIRKQKQIRWGSTFLRTPPAVPIPLQVPRGARRAEGDRLQPVGQKRPVMGFCQ